jgi:hypothetical protein
LPNSFKGLSLRDRKARAKERETLIPQAIHNNRTQVPEVEMAFLSTKRYMPKKPEQYR